jgi:hypothetical protein
MHMLELPLEICLDVAHEIIEPATRVRETSMRVSFVIKIPPVVICNFLKIGRHR